MNDDVKAALEWLRTVDRDDDDYEDLALLLAHIDGEPARTAAAVARAREEMREACANSCPTCKGVGWVMRERDCPFCGDSTHDHECPRDLEKRWCHCGAVRIRATPLDSTPLADELTALRARVKELEERMEVVLRAGPSTALATSVFDRAKKAEAATREVVAALKFMRGCQSNCACHEQARAVLAKHPEGT